MKIQNTPDEKRRLKGRYRIENFIRRLKERVGEVGKALRNKRGAEPRHIPTGRGVAPNPGF
jgi:hypothetical protein